MHDSHMKRWGVVYILLVLFVVSLAGQFFAELSLVRSDAQMHGETFSWPEYWPQFTSAVLENWQSEWLQLFVQALLVVGFADRLFKKSQEETDQIKEKLNQLEQLIKDKQG
jgi:hypothetical protein